MPPTPVDYLILGHLAADLTPDGLRLGGTAAYAALTARALGMRVGIVTSVPDDFDLAAPLAPLQMARLPADRPTTFENTYDAGGKRHQLLSGQATPLTPKAVPTEWLRAPIVHLAPIIDEVPPQFASLFPNALLGVTPQGWLRTWDEAGHVRPARWDDPDGILETATAVVLSIEDIGFDEDIANQYAAQAHILAVTRGGEGCSVHWQDGWQHFPAPSVSLVDPTGSGDIFAAAYFHRLHVTHDPHEAARFAVQIASASVTRPGIQAIPTPADIQQAMQTTT